MIEIKELSFGYGEKPILRDLNFQCHPGDKIGLVGPNGSGKTTFFQLIAGLQKPFRGEIRIFQRLCQEEKDFREIRKRLGFLFQNPDHQLFSPTVAEDIAFGPFNQGKSKDEVHEIVHKTCDLLGLNGFEDRVPYHLSWGEKKLVALATIVSMNPEIYLLDEPTAGLDEKVSARLLNYLTQNSKTYIIASHDYNFLKSTTEKMFRIENGKLKEITVP